MRNQKVFEVEFESVDFAEPNITPPRGISLVADIVLPADENAPRGVHGIV
jgi:hypothetical protein